MSNWREQYEDESGVGLATAWLGHYYHYVLVSLLLAFTFWNRARNWENFIVNGKVLFRGNDPWYHYRSVQYTVNNYPQTMPFDPWTYFPNGTASSQFGTFFDQIMATIALVVGLGSPSNELVRKVVLVSPALFGTLVLIPAYFIGRRLGGRFGGVMGVAILAFAPDGLLSRSVAGFSDHHVAEALFQALAVLAIMVALSVAQREKPVYELLADREFDALRKPLGYSMLAGVAIAAYLWTWPPGVILLGILGVFFAIHLSAEVVRGNSPEHTALVGAVALTTAGLLQLPPLATLEISATARSLLQPGLAFGVAFGCVFMTWLFREWEARDISKVAYPGAVLGILVALAAVTWLVLPGIFNYFVDQVLRVIGFQTSPTAGTVGEAQPLDSPQTLYSFYRLAIVTAVTGFGLIIIRQLLSRDPPAEELLVAIWFVFLVAATFTQARFSYYLAVPVAGLTAVTIGAVMEPLGSLKEATDVEPYEVMTVVSVVLIVLAPMFIGPGLAVSSASMDRAGDAARPGGVVGWTDSLDWMENNTPAEGQYANPDGEVMDYYGTFAKTDDYDYPEGAYGVMSWWDYGHWITAEGERIPNANPFQQGSDVAAKFLTAQSEERAQEVLNNLDEDDATTQYVMVDWKMAETETQTGGKYFAPLRFNDNTSRSEHYTRVASIDSLRQSGLVAGTDLIRHKSAYYNSTLARLYWYHGSAKNPDPVVIDWQGAERDLGNGDTFVEPPSDGQPVKRFNSMSAAREFVANDSTSQLGGVGAAPTHRIPALEHYRLVHMDDVPATASPQFGNAFQRTVQNNPVLSAVGGPGQNVTTEQRRQEAQDLLWAENTPAWTKTFERVPGATIEGSGAPANATVRVAVRMNPENGRNFTYSQQAQADENGDFTATVPYASTGYDALGPDDGYTNTSVRATGPYQITAGSTIENGTFIRYTGTANVSESQVVGADDSAADVTLERQEQEINTGDENDGNSSDGSDDSTTDDSNTDDSTTDDSTNDGTNGTSGGNAAAGAQQAIDITAATLADRAF